MTQEIVPPYWQQSYEMGRELARIFDNYYHQLPVHEQETHSVTREVHVSTNGDYVVRETQSVTYDRYY